MNEGTNAITKYITHNIIDISFVILEFIGIIPKSVPVKSQCENIK